MQGAYVLENKKGQVVRTLRWESPRLVLVYRKDTRRIEPVENIQDLIDLDIPHEILAEVSDSDVQKKPVKLADAGFLKWVPEITEMSPSIKTQEDSSEDYYKALKWAALVQCVLLAFVFVMAHFAQGPQKPEEEQQVVQVMPRPQVVSPMTHKASRARVRTAPVAKRRVVAPKVAQVRANRKSKAREISINNVGVLSVLGSSLNKANRDGGLKLSAVKTSRGPGLGGAAGSGGVQTSIYGKGLLSAALGPEARLQGSGGYGRHGSGGGQGGYGRLSMVGSSSAYFQPVESEAEIEGGLDREQIAEVIQRHLGQIRYCYEHGLQIDPSLKGRVAVKFLIGGTGIVSTAQVANTSLHSDRVESCIVSRLRSWKFPEPRGGVIVKVNYPFVLKRVSQG